MRTLRILTVAAALAALGLGGCNLVYTEKPMFGAADAAGAPRLKPGIWAAIRKDCAFDRTSAPETWPECASPTQVTAERIGELGKADSMEPYLLVGDDPALLQLQGKMSTSVGSGAETQKSQKPMTFYFAFQPEGPDEKGEVSGGRIWVIQCGPPPAAAPSEAAIKAKGPKAWATSRPLPGMTLDDGGGCQPADRAALTRAAKASEDWKWMGELTAFDFRWIRP
jgi:hypothetical protein